MNGQTRANLQTLYRDASLCTWDSAQLLGMQAIMSKKMTLFPPTMNVQHNMTTCDSQPVVEGQAIKIMITGDMAPAGQPTPVKFSIAFLLLPEGGSWIIANQIFRTAGNAAVNPPNAADKSDVGKAFTDFYYQTFDSPDRSGLQNLYQDNSLLTFENEPHMGVQAIMTKLTTLNFQTVQHLVATLDCQPHGAGILVMVVGDLAVDGGVTTPLKFVQSFVLNPTPAGSWFINHDIFRLNIG